MDSIAKTYITNKIEMLLNNKNYQNFESFYKQNSSFKQFKINHPQIQTIIAHFGLITEDDYSKIIVEIKQKFYNNINNQTIEDRSKNNQNNIQQSIDNIKTFDDNNKADNSTTKVKVRKLNMNKINGFVDAMILAFITGSFLGIIFLNLYSKIISSI